MNPFMQYGQVHGHRHPKRPWWTVTKAESCTGMFMLSCRYSWVRDDGEETDLMDWSYEEEGENFKAIVCRRDLPLLDHLDLLNPVPKPNPCAGQVWRGVSDSRYVDKVIGAVEVRADGRFQFTTGDTDSHLRPIWVAGASWPPGQLLLDGPGAPWMSPGFKLSSYNGWGSEDWGLE